MTAAPFATARAGDRHGFIASDLPSPRAWKRSELRTIAAHYPTGGLRACRTFLPHRTDGAIRRCAERLGIRRGPRGGRA